VRLKPAIEMPQLNQDSRKRTWYRVGPQSMIQSVILWGLGSRLLY